MDINKIFEIRQRNKYGWGKFLFEHHILPLKTQGYTYTLISEILTERGFPITDTTIYNIVKKYGGNKKKIAEKQNSTNIEFVQKQEIKKINMTEKDEIIEYLARGGSVKKPFGIE